VERTDQPLQILAATIVHGSPLFSQAIITENIVC
jgi:hypothetical protein